MFPPFEKSVLSSLFDICYILSPVLGFLPQLYSKRISYEPLLSVLSVLANILKIFSSKNTETDPVMLYQFATVAILHLLLLKIRFNQIKLDSSPVTIDLPYSTLLRTKHLGQGAIYAIAAFFILLKIVDSTSIALFFMEIAVAIEVLISILHVRYYTKGNLKPRELFAFWILGDTIKLYLMYIKYEKCPLICYGGILAQIGVNLYVLLS